MLNPLDQFIEMGNLQSSPLIDDRFTWGGKSWLGVISDLARDMFFEQDAAGKRNNAEKRLECRLSQFGESGRPKIGDRITDEQDGLVYEILAEDSIDTTNAVYRLRQPIARI